MSDLCFAFFQILLSTYPCHAHVMAIGQVGKGAPCPQSTAACPSPHKAPFSIVPVPPKSSLPALPLPPSASPAPSPPALTAASLGVDFWGLTLPGRVCCNPAHCVSYHRGTRKWSYPVSTSTILTVTSGSMNISLHPGSVCPMISQP